MLQSKSELDAKVLKLKHDGIYFLTAFIRSPKISMKLYSILNR